MAELCGRGNSSAQGQIMRQMKRNRDSQGQKKKRWSKLETRRNLTWGEEKE